MKFDIITKEKFLGKKILFGVDVPLFILGEIDGFNPKTSEEIRRKCYKTIYRHEFGDNWLDEDINFRMLDEEKSSYFHEIKDVETRNYEDKLRFRTFINFQPKTRKLKKKIHGGMIYFNDEEIFSDLVFNGGFFRCDLNMNDIETKFYKEETNLIELHLLNEADNIIKHILKNKDELNNQIMQNITLIK